MPCALTQNITVDCRNSIGGIKQAWVKELALVSAVTASNGVVSGVQTSGSLPFYRYQFVKQTGGMTENITASEENGSVFYTPEVTLQFNKLEVNKRNEIALLAANAALAVAVQDNNGSVWYLGKQNGLAVSAGTAQAGKAFGDLNGYTLTLAGGEPEPMYQLSGSFLGTIFPGSV